MFKMFKKILKIPFIHVQHFNDIVAIVFKNIKILLSWNSLLYRNSISFCIANIPSIVLMKVGKNLIYILPLASDQNLWRITNHLYPQVMGFTSHISSPATSMGCSLGIGGGV